MAPLQETINSIHRSEPLILEDQEGAMPRPGDHRCPNVGSGQHVLNISDAVVARRTRRVAGKPRFGILRRSTGELIADIPDNYYVDRGFFNGLAVVRDLKTQNFGYISRTGELVVPANFSRAAPFKGGYAHVSLKQHFEKAVINLAGEVIWKARLPEVGVPEPAEKEADVTPPEKEE